MFFNTFLGCTIFLITNASLLYTAHLLVRRFLPNAPPAVRLVALGTLFYAFIILIFQALSPFYAIGKIGVTLSCLFIATVAQVLWGSLRNIHGELEPIRTWLRDGLNSRWAALIIICGFVVLLSFSRALLMPPLSWDALTYHLTFAALWIKKGALLYFNAPDQLAENVHFPINGDIFTSWFLLPFHNDLIVNTVNFPVTFLGGLSCYAICRELGFTRKEAGFSPLLLCFAPVVYAQITTAYTDNAVFAFGSASALFTLRYLRRGYGYDCIFSSVAAGILLGTKFTGIAVAAVIFASTALKTARLSANAGLIKKASLLTATLLIFCMLGGRQYIRNTIQAGNPLYPFPLKVFNHEVLEGSAQLDDINTWVADYEKENGLDAYTWWEREYKKFSYATRAAGPKFLLFLVLASTSLIIRPRSIPRMDWCFLALLWILPTLLFYTNSSADFTRRATWIEGSTRFLSFPIALFTIQGLCTLKYFSKHSSLVDFLLAGFIAWDLLCINATHLPEITILYPVVILSIVLLAILWTGVSNTFNTLSPAKATASSMYPSLQLNATTLKYCTTFAAGFIALLVGLSFLQSYRDNTRYIYYRGHTDLHPFPRTLVAGWEFLDQPDKKMTIALTMDWQPPGHTWFFYPLLGRHLQNDVVYVSAKHKWEVPTWLDRGLVRGHSLSTWLYNLQRKKIDYIVVAKPWPIELSWMLHKRNMFRLVFSDEAYKIFNYKKATVQ